MPATNPPALQYQAIDTIPLFPRKGLSLHLMLMGMHIHVTGHGVIGHTGRRKFELFIVHYAD